MPLLDRSHLPKPTTEILSLNNSIPRLSMVHFPRESNGLSTNAINYDLFLVGQ